MGDLGDDSAKTTIQHDDLAKIVSDATCEWR